jgi:uroporphyrinogen III methyltransferase/synthase
MAGRAYIVGAGPGDPGLLTLRAVSVLERADSVLYDALVSDDVMQYVPARAERIFVGKRCGAHTMAQDEINALMVRLARSGHVVVRLKGGDPFVFGRGGEELQALREAHVPCEIVPGISSALAVPASAGIPLTHRGVSGSFAVATGYNGNLSRETGTLVLLMSLGKIAEIAEGLVADGYSADLPVAVIENGTLPAQRTITGTLRTIGPKVATAQLTGPAVIVVGEVVKLARGA